MDKRLALGIGVGSLVGLCIFAKRAAAGAILPPLPRGSRVLLVGDSLGVGLQSRLEVDAKDAGYAFSANTKGSTHVYDWSPKIGDILKAERPNLVLASLGTNDALLHDVESEQGQLHAFVRAVYDAGARLVWIFPPTMPDRFSAGLQHFRAMVRAEGVETIDSTLVLVPRSQDAVHPYGTGYADWADWIWTTLQTRGVVY